VQRWLEESWPADHVVVDDANWPDPMRAASTIVRADAESFCRILAAACAPAAEAAAWRERWLAMSASARGSLEHDLISEATLFDAVVLRSLVGVLPDGATLMVGNSMPVRDADAFLGGSHRRLRVMANRGASGIDGVLSTGLGIAIASAAASAREGACSGPTALVVGDLSFLHDSAALAFAARERIPLLVVVVNNDGGGIFSYLPLRDALGIDGTDVFERFFGTPHGTDLEKVAAIAGSFFARVDDRAGLDSALAAGLAAAASGPAVVEVLTSREGSRVAHQSIVSAAQAAVIPSQAATVSRRTA
jgi:2-succinyl-5-enolpyruvyl-6-hydroxy-3-cyclohexene-1-carboxylate synthase